MSKELIQKEFEKIFPKESTQAYRNYLVDKYGEEEVVKMENANSIVSEVLNDMITELIK